MCEKQQLPEISVIVPSLNGSRLLKRCLETFRHTAGDVDCEWIVIDDGSTAEEKASMRCLARRYDFQLLEHDARQSYAKSVNDGLKRARGRYLLLLNNDVWFEKRGWLPQLLHTCRQADNIGIVGCRLLHSDGTVQHAGGVLLPDLRYEHLYRGYPGNDPRPAFTYDVESVTGALMLIKRNLLRDVGLLCEDYSLSYEDVDFCLRARKKGWRVVYCGKAQARHDEGATRGRREEEKPRAWLEEEIRSYMTFWERWKDEYEKAKPLRHLRLHIHINKAEPLLSDPSLVLFWSYARSLGCNIEVIKKSDAERAAGIIVTNDAPWGRSLKNRRVWIMEPGHREKKPYPENAFHWVNQIVKMWEERR